MEQLLYRMIGISYKTIRSYYYTFSRKFKYKIKRKK